MTLKFSILTTVTAIALSGLFSPPANATQHADFNDNICRKHTNQQERLHRIPKNLLTAVSIAESGHWNKDKKEIIAWPWTVTAQGKGNYYPSKSVAISAVKELKAQGIKNIDVGCMQINLYYHPHAFDSLEEAFDPQTNTEYSAGFLKRLFDSKGSWNQATAFYHSATPERGMKYKERVLGLWNEIQRAEPAVKSARVKEMTNPYIVPVDFNRSKKVNNFIKNRNTQSLSGKKREAGELMKSLAGPTRSINKAKKKGRSLRQYLNNRIPSSRRRI